MLGRATDNTDTQDSPRPRLGGSHHLPPYSILCDSSRSPHPNGYFSRDSRVRVPKSRQMELPGLWSPITLRADLGLQCDLKQSCSSRRELSNALSHSRIGHREEVDSRLFALTPGLLLGLTPGLPLGFNSRASSWPAPLQFPFALVASPKLRLRQF